MRKIKVMSVLVIVLSITFMPILESRIFITSSLPDMGPGSTGSDVEQVQQRLKNWGYYDGDVDGVYGWNTFLSIQDYQRKSGLYINGFAGYETLTAMGLTSIAQAGTVYAATKGKATDEQLMARAINGEARGEPYEGQVAVGAVILNRTRDSRFPKTISGVIYQPLAFTAVADGQINVPIDPKSTVVKAARDALNGWDPTNGCLYYWNPATATSKWIWTRKIVKKIGKHNFGI